MNAETKPRNPDYQVGYGRPPKHSRFRKGQSGNPAGRSRFAETGRVKQLMRRELYRMVTIREGGKVVRMPAIQAVLRKQILLAAQGNASATREVFKVLSLIEGLHQKVNVEEAVRAAVIRHEDALDMLDEPEEDPLLDVATPTSHALAPPSTNALGPQAAGTGRVAPEKVPGSEQE